jgi:isoleucyl-tRNA synthetase
LRYDETIINNVANQMELAGGADIWFSKSADELLPKGTTCKQCGEGTFNKENDILDVWFESGVSYAAVLKRRQELDFPAELYLEGSDQHRGWFHSSLLASLSSGRNRAPYEAVLTHGFTVDGTGKKMSKSSGNVVAPQEIIDRYGAEILRLWVAATDFRDDVKISNAILEQLVEAHRKIRNTCRFLISNLYDYPLGYTSPSGGFTKFLEIDRWALHRWKEVKEKILSAYEQFEFHTVFHALNQFCSVDLSTFYLDIIKDRLYASSANGPERRAAQIVLSAILSDMTRLMAPILSFTAEEIWSFLPENLTEGISSVHLASIFLRNDGTHLRSNFWAGMLECPNFAEWDRLIQVRNDVNCHLEKARADKQISSSLGACVSIGVPAPLYEQLKQRESFLPTFFIVSQVDMIQSESMEIVISQARGTKCERCWVYAEEVGQNTDHPTLCERCVKVFGDT